MNLAEFREHLQGVVGGPEKFNARCPGHDDKHASLAVGIGEKGILLNCHAGCATENVLASLGLTFRDLMLNGNGHRPGGMNIIQTYDYRDADGRVLYQVCRLSPKDFRARRPDGTGGHIWNLNGTERVLYRLPELPQSQSGVFVTEGEKDVDRLRGLGLTATCNPGGAGKWRKEFNAHFSGRHVAIIPDNDPPGRLHAETVATQLHGVAASVRVVTLPGLAEHGDVSDYLDGGGTIADLKRLAREAAEWTPTIVAVPEPKPSAIVSLVEVVAVFRKWLHMPDPDPLLALLATIAANRRQGDPVWLMLVAPSSWGKSEILGSTTKLIDVYPAATITEASLLSGTPKREKAQEAKGGLLREIGDSGILLCKDFGSILNMGRDARASVLAALREIYDGSWTRHVGTDGGRTLSWQGKVGFIGGCTPAIDRHHAVMSSMGERFCFVRLPDDQEAKVARRALQHAGREGNMRAELTTAVSGLFAGLDINATAPELSDPECDRLVGLTTLTVRCRSAVDRDSYSREIELIPGAESPGRLARVSANLLAGLHVIGLDRPAAWRVMQRVVLDSMPMLRRKVLLAVVNAEHSVSTTSVAERTEYPTVTARRQLEDLTAYGVLNRHPQGQGKADVWTLSDWTSERLQEIGTFSEVSEGMSDV